MTLDNIKNIIPSGFEIQPTDFGSNQVYLLQKSGNNIVAKILLDLNENNEVDNIKEYQEKYVSKDYFDSQGYLQWNYYLIFLRNSISKNLKRKIEKDESYTRKYVFNKEELKNYLQYDQSSSQEENDIVGSWKTKLIDVDLQEIFSDEPYSEAIKRFINNSTKKLKELKPIDSEPDANENFILDEISALKLNDSYRDYPKLRKYKLGKVNLICGPNGVGKTSLMEAVELIVTGKNARNIKSSTKDNSIEAEYQVNFDIKKDIFLRESSKYKARDYYWYNKSYSKYKSDSLYQSFNRYNFYNSDSAYHLSNDSDNDLNKYLSSIALGTEFGAIRERLEGFKDRLKKEFKILDKDLNQLKENQKSATLSINRLKEIINPEELFQKFIREAKTIEWKKTLPNKFDSDSTSFEDDFKVLIDQLNSIIHSKAESELEVEIKLRKLKFLKSSFIEIHKKKTISLEKKSKIINNLTSTQNNINLIEKSLRFLEKPEAFKIGTLNRDIKSLKIQTQNNEILLHGLEQLELEEINNSSSTFSELEIKLELEYKNKNEILHNSEEQLAFIKATTNSLNSIIAEIKFYGKEYLETKKDIDACPLCEATQSRSQLLSKIEKNFNQEESIEKIEVFNQNNKKLKIELNAISSKINTLKKYDKLLYNYLGNTLSNLKLSEIASYIENLKLKFGDDLLKLENLIDLSQKLKIEGVTFEIFQELKSNFEGAFNPIIFHPKNINEISDLLGKYAEKSVQLKTNLENENNQIKKLEKELDKLLIKDYNSLKYEQELDFDIKELENYLIHFKSLRTFVEFRKNGFILDLRHSLESLYETFKIYKEQLTSSKEYEFAEKILSKANKGIEEIIPKHKRILSGLKIITDILTNDNEEKVLNKFFRKNERDISDIFTQIHTPKEFSGLSIKDGQINLYKEDGQKKIPIQEISTGQRSALALSIFLALNKKLKKGPNLIIFDDPVTYTDDLNILSFLDYLRSMVLNESRQLIFATASSKIASLFEKKFQFLQDDFNKIELSRTDF